tara:strand:+ start:26 stop:415 length:390 start_codon:yes stop_codon:yes gene_type:complete
MASHNITFDPESGTPYAANLNIYGGAGFDDTFTVTRPNSTAYDFTGYSGAAQMTKSVAVGSTVAITATFTVGFTSAAGGKIALTLADTLTRNINEGRYVYDVNIVSAGSTYYKLVRGDVMVHAGVSTRP